MSIILCISKFQDDFFDKKFLLLIDCKIAKDVLQKDVNNLVQNKYLPVGKQFYLLLFSTLNSSKENNSLPDFPTREFLQGRSDKTPFMQVFTMNKKYEGNGIQTNDDNKIVPTKNSFQSLANFPNLPYKTVVTKPPTKPSRDNYFL